MCALEAQNGKEFACNVGDWGSIPGSGRSPGGGNGNSLQYSRWRIPWTEEPGGPQSMGSQRVGHDLGIKQQLKQAFGPPESLIYPLCYKGWMAPYRR